MRCSVKNCTSDTRRNNKRNGVTFHMFPKQVNLRSAWVEALGIPDWEPKERSTICSEHFRKEDFYETKGGLRRIKCGAVPIVIMTESLGDLDAPAALRVCRICLVMDTKMYHIREHKLDQMYEQITGLTAAPEDRLPQRVCWECAARLSAASRFRSKALRADILLQDTLRSDTYIKIRDVRSISRKHNGLSSSLVQHIYENDDFDLHVKDLNIKTENIQEAVEIPPDSAADIDVKSLAPINEMDVKDESSNEIFFDEYDHFDDDDDKALSEVYVEKKESAPKVRKKRDKVVKKVKQKKLKVEEESDPNTCSDKYKTTDVKRRRNHESFDESLFTITPLTYDQQIEEIMKRQESYNYTSAPYKCTICYRGFQIKDRFNAHSVRHSEQCGAYECFICKTRLKTSRALRKHLTAQHTEQYSCKGCPFVTRNRGVAREHEKWHAGTKYQCPHCASEFDKITTYMGHIRIKHVSDFVCELCGYTFVSKKGIDVHKKKKHRMYNKEIPLEGPYCEMCDVKFLSVEAHDRHLKLSSRHSSDHDPNRIRNDSQSMNAERSGRVMRRIERRPVIHPRLPTDDDDPQNPVNCEQCGLQLRDLRVYAQHFRRAHPDKNRTKYPAMKTPCMCEQCGKIFQSMALLKDHMWIHTGEKRFKCDRCTKSFTQKTNLVFHMRVHSATRPSYECPLCGKHFAFFNNRRRHMFIHTGLKPFKCDTCGKSFTTAGEHRAHVEHVHMKKPWPKRARHRNSEWKGDDPTVED
ncbi:hypothetical protein PYW08_012262 [Mythimna loreyi]|uniref:Uncharacterized protein n=1 Tax=Mythimna loreyi TaxID=667449 RepID=A0ACC2Q1J7_9NEOP|nr:hypothetical protein PYW08_012262 [Mythimna loreyi]